MQGCGLENVFETEVFSLDSQVSGLVLIDIMCPANVQFNDAISGQFRNDS